MVETGKGDFDGDSKITVSDFVGLKKYLTSGEGKMTKETRKAVDIVNDGVIDVFDLAALQWQIVHQ